MLCTSCSVKKWKEFNKHLPVYDSLGYCYLLSQMFNMFLNRGGGGDDPSWHKTGNGVFKQNSIHDFVSCGKYLIDEGFVQRDQLSAIGVSAGCLLIGAALNMYLNLFRAAILKVCHFSKIPDIYYNITLSCSITRS